MLQTMMMRSFHLFLRPLVIFKTRIFNIDSVRPLVCPKPKQINGPRMLMEDHSDPQRKEKGGKYRNLLQ